MIGTVTVVNRNFPKGPNVIYIGRGSIFGNPFPLPTYTREQSIAEYRKRFNLLTTSDTPLRKAVDALAWRVLEGENISLQCFCAPLPCHGDVLKEYIIDKVIALA